jgi:Zn-dependent metalloprotease
MTSVKPVTTFGVAPKTVAPPWLGAKPTTPLKDAIPTLPIAPPPSTGHSDVSRETYTAKNVELPEGQLGELRRTEGQPAIGDSAVDAAHDNAGIVHDFYKQVLGRNSVDGTGMQLQSIAHYGKDFNNAYWDGNRMTYGDGDGTTFSPFPQSLDVVAHEISHGLTERTAGLNYENQPGALNESVSDVFGELVEQWARNKETFKTPEGAKQANWMIGEGIFTPGTDGDALRSLKAPGTAYPDDPQPAHMKDYKNMSDDNGGVHVNSGIPNKAAYEVAMKLGGEKTAKIWYKALTDYLKPTSTFKDAANATVSAARDLFTDGSEMKAVRDAWKAVGNTPRQLKAPVAAPPQPGIAPVRVTSTRNPGVVPPWLRTPGAKP